MVFFLCVCLPKPCMHLSFATYVLHALPISFFLILSPKSYLVRSTEYKAPHIPFPLLRLYRRIRTSPRFCEWFVTWLSFYGDVLLASRPTPKLEVHPLSATAYSIYLQLPSMFGSCSSILSRRMHHAVVTGTHLSRLNKKKNIYI